MIDASTTNYSLHKLSVERAIHVWLISEGTTTSAGVRRQTMAQMFEPVVTNPTKSPRKEVGHTSDVTNAKAH